MALDTEYSLQSELDLLVLKITLGQNDSRESHVDFGRRLRPCFEPGRTGKPAKRGHYISHGKHLVRAKQQASRAMRHENGGSGGDDGWSIAAQRG